MSINLYLDIETIPTQSEDLQNKIIDSVSPPKNIKKEESIAKWNEEKREGVALEKLLKTSLDGAFGEVMVIGSSIDEQEPTAVYRDRVENSEKELLEDWFEKTNEGLRRISGHENPVVKMIGHNLISFDLRFLFNRCVVLGVKPPQWFMRCLKASPYSGEVYDTMLEWAGYRNTVSLSTLVDVLGLQGKGDEIGEEIDGSQVWYFIKNDRVEEVVLYCIGDVVRVKQAYKKMNFI